ncbi:hypothetical protein [Streptomyces sp. NPDC088775]|uniref:hypothetical protein n=1 Tax=Streptomyces sp. NPDC088775 TaxID=3365896 RepID=UPI0037FC774E
MSKFQLVIKGATGHLVPVSSDNPLPMVIADGAGTLAAPAAPELGPAVADAPSGATTAQLRATLNELLAALRTAGVIADSDGGE